MRVPKNNMSEKEKLERIIEVLDQMIHDDIISSVAQGDVGEASEILKRAIHWLDKH